MYFRSTVLDKNSCLKCQNRVSIIKNYTSPATIIYYWCQKQSYLECSTNKIGCTAKFKSSLVIGFCYSWFYHHQTGSNEGEKRLWIYFMFQHTNLLDSILKSGLSHTCIHIQIHQKIFLLILSDIPKS